MSTNGMSSRAASERATASTLSCSPDGVRAHVQDRGGLLGGEAGVTLQDRDQPLTRQGQDPRSAADPAGAGRNPPLRVSCGRVSPIAAASRPGGPAAAARMRHYETGSERRTCGLHLVPLISTLRSRDANRSRTGKAIGGVPALQPQVRLRNRYREEDSCTWFGSRDKRSARLEMTIGGVPALAKSPISAGAPPTSRIA